MGNENPAGAQQPLTRDEARAELERVATDPKHEHHEGYKRGWTTASDYVESVYRRIAGGDAKVAIDTDVNGIGTAGVVVADDAGADTAFRASVDTAIKERGVPLEAVHAESAKLFAGEAGGAVLDMLDERTLTGLAPEAKRDAHVHLASYLAELNQLRSSATPGGEAVAPEAFQAQYLAELKKRGINVQTLDETLDHLFAGRADAYQHFIKHLDGMPPAARLAAYVRSAEAVLMFSRLAQSQS